MNFRREKAIGANVALQFAATPQTQVRSRTLITATLTLSVVVDSAHQP